MKVVFISYWGIDQGLTQSTVIPHIEILARDNRVISIHLITFERDSFVEVKNDQYKHIPIDESASIRGLNKFSSIRKCYKILKSLKPDLVMARSSLAGIAAYHYNKKTETPYTVESFEPHPDYMIDAGEWKKYGIKSSILKKYELKMRNTALFLLPVAHNYKELLIREGVKPNQIITLPCTVDQNLFAFNEIKRKNIRSQLGISESVTVGIYVGKFGGLYQEDEAFKTFRKIGDQFNSFNMLIISPMHKDAIIEIASKNNYPLDQLHILSVEQNEVPGYLSAADIGIATFKSFHSNRYCSPIKIGEYWATGLFTCITENVGDDSEIIEKEQIGSIIEKGEDVSALLNHFKKENAVNAAKKFRNRNLIISAYNTIIGDVHSKIS